MYSLITCPVPHKIPDHGTPIHENLFHIPLPSTLPSTPQPKELSATETPFFVPVHPTGENKNAVVNSSEYISSSVIRSVPFVRKYEWNLDYENWFQLVSSKPQVSDPFLTLPSGESLSFNMKIDQHCPGFGPCLSFDVKVQKRDEYPDKPVISTVRMYLSRGDGMIVSAKTVYDHCLGRCPLDWLLQFNHLDISRDFSKSMIVRVVVEGSYSEVEYDTLPELIDT